MNGNTLSREKWTPQSERYSQKTVKEGKLYWSLVSALQSSAYIESAIGFSTSHKKESELRVTDILHVSHPNDIKRLTWIFRDWVISYLSKQLHSHVETQASFFTPCSLIPFTMLIIPFCTNVVGPGIQNITFKLVQTYQTIFFPILF